MGALSLKTKARGRVREYLRARQIKTLSLRELMDLFLPAADAPVADLEDCWAQTPILDQPQFGWMLYDQALLALMTTQIGPIAGPGVGGAPVTARWIDHLSANGTFIGYTGLANWVSQLWQRVAVGPDDVP